MDLFLYGVFLLSWSTQNNLYNMLNSPIHTKTGLNTVSQLLMNIRSPTTLLGALQNLMIYWDFPIKTIHKRESNQ